MIGVPNVVDFGAPAFLVGLAVGGVLVLGYALTRVLGWIEEERQWPPADRLESATRQYAAQVDARTFVVWLGMAEPADSAAAVARVREIGADAAVQEWTASRARGDR